MADDEPPQWLLGVEGGRRRERSRRIGEVDGVLAELYLQACEFVERPISTVSMSILGHAMRELLNGLAAGLAAAEGVELPDRHDDSDEIKALVEVWETNDLSMEDHDGSTEPASSVRPMPAGVYSAVQRVVRGQQTVTANSRTRLAQIAGPGADASAPLSTQLKRVYDLFMDWCHVKRGSPRPLPTEDEVRSAMAQIESILDVRLSSFFDIKSDLDDILSITNKPTGSTPREADS